jgi:predicted HD phosphohydrolase
MPRPDEALRTSQTVIATSLDEVLDVLRYSATFDLTLDPAEHHDLLDHGLQTAAILREERPGDVELQIAGLVHDIGHVLPPFDDAVHGDVAAAFVRPVLGDRVAELVRLHVPAKRYLTTTEPDYRGVLNWGSTLSLEHQGGEMRPEEVRAFEDLSLSDDAIALRRADERAKVAGLRVVGLEGWTEALQQVSASTGQP